MSDPPLIPETISCLVAQVAKAHRRCVSEALEDLGLHVGQEMVLLRLWEQDGLSQSELAERLIVEPPTLSKMLNHLEKMGLLERRKCREDARVCRIYLTARGKALQGPMLRCWQALDDRLLAHFTHEERWLLRRFLLQIGENLTS